MFECHQNGSLAKLFGPKADEGQSVKDAGRVPPRERERVLGPDKCGYEGTTVF